MIPTIRESASRIRNLHVKAGGPPKLRRAATTRRSFERTGDAVLSETR